MSNVLFPLATVTAEAGPMEFRGLQTLDWLVIVGYGLFVIGLGWFYSRRQSSTEEYFLAGRSTGALIAGISLFATLMSTVSYLSTPGEIMKNGPVFFAGCVSAPIVYLLVGYVVIPAIMRVPVTSAYELLETRLGLGVRILGAIIFMVTRTIWMGLLLYVSAKALVTMLHWTPATLPYVVAVLGVVAVIYTMMGGLRAVMITDVVQFFILLGGLVLTVVSISVTMGGPGQWWPSQWAAHWDSQPFFSLSPNVRVTLFGSMLAYSLFWICSSISDQVTVQRYLTTRDAKTARRAFLTNLVADIVVSIFLLFTGFALLGFFSHHPQFLPESGSLLDEADYLFPHYIANFLPAGIAGLVVSAMLAAAMSSLDSGLNSIATVLSVDFLDRLGSSAKSDHVQLKIARRMILVLGMVVILMACFIGYVPGNLLELVFKTVGLFFGPMAGLFVMALFFRWANGPGAIIGAVCGFVTAFVIAFWDLFSGEPALSFQWIIPSALIVHLVVGSLASLVWKR